MAAPAPQTGMIDGKLGVRLAYRWRQREDARAVVIIVHGVAEHAGRYEHVVDALYGRGFSVLSYDQRGHGVSEGPRVFVNRFSEYTDDLDRFVDFVARAQPGLPCFVLGHSMGGLVLATHLIAHPGRLAGALLSSPGFIAAVPVPAWKETLAKVASRLAPKLAVPTDIPPEWVSRDAAVVAAYAADPLVTTKATTRWYTEFVDAQARALAGAGRVRTPTLILSAGADKIVDPAGTDRFFRALGAEDKTLIPYPALYHEVLNEPEKGAVIKDVGDWLVARAPER